MERGSSAVECRTRNRKNPCSKRVIRIIKDNKCNAHTEHLLKSLLYIIIKKYIHYPMLEVFFLIIRPTLMVVFLFFPIVFLGKCMTTKLCVVTKFVFRTVILPKPGNVLYHLHMLLNTLRLQSSGGQPPARGPDPAHEDLASSPPPCSATTLQSGQRNPSHKMPIS